MELPLRRRVVHRPFSLLTGVVLTATLLVPAAVAAAAPEPEGRWEQLGATIESVGRLDEFGRSVAVSADGNTVAVKANGYVRVHRYDEQTGLWAQLGADLHANGGDMRSRLLSLAADGETVAIGSPWDGPGHVRVYRYEAASGWVQLGATIRGEVGGDDAGQSVSLAADGETVAIGAPYNDGGGQDSGHVRVYRYDTATSGWVQLGADIDGEGTDDRSGWSVSMSADGATVAIGAPNNTNGGGTASGHVRVYHYLLGAWAQVGDDIDGKEQINYAGWTVSLSADGTTLALGAPGAHEPPHRGFNGDTRVYALGDSGWVQIGEDIAGEATQDTTDDYEGPGMSVSLSADGTTVAVGAPFNDDGDSNSGHVRVHTLTDGGWIQVGDDIDGEARLGWFGWSVALSADGTTMAVGSPRTDGNGYRSGHARVYAAGVAPVIDAPAEVTTEATGPAGATVAYDVAATDAIDGDVAVDCAPASGTTFPLGVTTVDCTATDTAGNTAEATFDVTVVDTTAPTLADVPDDRTLEATGPAGTPVAYAAPAATDLVDGDVAVDCAPASGTTFPLGVTTVDCTATDTAGNTAEATFDVTVVDTTAPTLADVPDDGTLEATGPAGTPVAYAAPAATDLVDGDVAVDCAPAAGTTFPLGVTTVDCTATDAAGNTAAASFDVTVVDTTAPTLAADTDIPDLTGDNAVQAEGPAGATVDYQPPTFDDPAATVSCDHGPGSQFAVGTTTVTCTAVDVTGNTGEVSFDVEVLAAALAAAGATPGPTALLALLLLATGALLTMLDRHRILG